MFGNNKNSKSMGKTKIESEKLISNERNIISQGTKILGTITSEGDFRIDGKLEGDIDIKGKLVIGETGNIEGNIKSSNMDSEGSIKGTANISGLLVLKSTSIIEGEVKTSKLSIENGAIFNVSCKMSDVTTSNKPFPNKINTK